MFKTQQLHDELVLIIQLFRSAYVYNKTFSQKKYKYLYFEIYKEQQLHDRWVEYKTFSVCLCLL